MIRIAQCDQNVILKGTRKKLGKKKTGKGLIRAVFIERFNKKLIKSSPSRSFFF
ncbi:hypothetical protein RHMOL_Rhmol02G0161700 [Rhododendron molle]|uniref:Uncharacterized protein n=1 Tax=Rhododendron molle TaxID=49168 RepID=A0ACC0PS50_RHOML|nr:hypothetical protein RHMOL_Rhmol02G0161700 [Rhododendron molle]